MENVYAYTTYSSFLELYAVEHNTSKYKDKICTTGIILVHIMHTPNLGFCILIPKSIPSSYLVQQARGTEDPIWPGSPINKGGQINTTQGKSEFPVLISHQGESEVESESRNTMKHNDSGIIFIFNCP